MDKNFNLDGHDQGLSFPNQAAFFDFQKRPKEASSSSPSHRPICMPVSVAEYPIISLNIPKYPWKYLNKLFWLCQASKYAWSTYTFGRLFKMPQFLNVPGFSIWHVCRFRSYIKFWICMNMTQYASIMPEHASIYMNVP